MTSVIDYTEDLLELVVDATRVKVKIQLRNCFQIRFTVGLKNMCERHVQQKGQTCFLVRSALGRTRKLGRKSRSIGVGDTSWVAGTVHGGPFFVRHTRQRAHSTRHNFPRTCHSHITTQCSCFFLRGAQGTSRGSNSGCSVFFLRRLTYDMESASVRQQSVGKEKKETKIKDTAEI